MGFAIKELREEKRWTQAELAERLTRAGLKLSRTAIIAREAGRTRIKAGEMRYYAKVFSLTPDEMDKKVLTLSRREATTEGRIPVVNRGLAGATLPMEDPQVLMSLSQALEYVDRGQVRDANAIAVVMPDASLEPAIFEGEYLIFVPAEMADVENGRVVLVHTEHRMYVGRVYGLGLATVSLRFDNPSRSPVTVRRADVAGLYRAVERRTQLGLVPA